MYGRLASEFDLGLLKGVIMRDGCSTYVGGLVLSKFGQGRPYKKLRVDYSSLTYINRPHIINAGD